jgi:hypothetical protein
LKLGLNAKLGGALLQLLNSIAQYVAIDIDLGLWLGCSRRMPVRVGYARAPPVAVRIKFLPQQPDLARALGQQVLTRKTHRHGKLLRAFPHQHDVAGMLHHRLRNHRHIFYVAHAAHGTSSSRGPVHTASIEFDHTFFVRQPSQADRVILGIILRTFDHANAGIERIATALQKSVGRFHVGTAIVRGNDDGELGRIGGSFAGAFG